MPTPVTKSDQSGGTSTGTWADLFAKGFDQSEGMVVDIVNLIQKRKEREQEERLAREKMAQDQRQFDITSSQNLKQIQNQAQQKNRDQNLSGMSILENQRLGAQKRAATQATGNFKTDFYNSLVG